VSDKQPDWRVEVNRVPGAGYEACIRSATELVIIQGHTLTELMDLSGQWMAGYR
jgi:hypothetical protein